MITSPTGAVIRDILHRLNDRFPRHVVVWPVRVQGDTAADEVAVAITGFNAMARRPDVLIVARGGGSIEDLWPFNEEVVVRAVAASVIPVISAVGHETDTTLIDFVSDWRAPTPTAAAERAVPVRAELQAAVASVSARQLRAMARLREQVLRDLQSAARALPKPDDILAVARQRHDGAAARLPHALRANLQRHALGLARSSGRHSLKVVVDRLRLTGPRVAELSGRLARGVMQLNQRRREQLAAEAKFLGSLSYQSTLARGYAIVRDAAGVPVMEAAKIRPASRVQIEFRDGTVGAVTDKAAGQGSLF